MICRGAAFTGDIQKLVIRLSTLDPRIDLMVEIMRQRRCVHHLSGQSDGRDDNLPVELVIETIPSDSGALGVFERADVVIQPSWGESFGLAILEGMACGKPVITTGWSGHLDFVPEGEDRIPFELRAADTVRSLRRAWSSSLPTSTKPA